MEVQRTSNGSEPAATTNQGGSKQRTSDSGGVGCRTSDGGGVGCREREERNGVVERNGDCGGKEEKEKRARMLAPVVNHPRPNM